MTALVESKMKTFEIPMNDLYCDNEFNCRGRIIPRDVDELTRSIESVGLQQPIVVQPWNKVAGKKWRIVSGHRRYTAFVVLGKMSIPAIIKENLDDLEAKKLNLVENLKRKDLNIVQEANAIKMFFDAGWKQQETADAMEQTLSWVQTRFSLLKLPEIIQDEAAAGFLTQEHIRQIAQLKGLDKQIEATKKIKNSKLLGEKRKIQVHEKKVDPLKKKKRKEHEIYEVMNIMAGSIGVGLHTRFAAWICGQISDFELHRDIENYAKENGKTYVMPPDIKNALGTG